MLDRVKCHYVDPRWSPGDNHGSVGGKDRSDLKEGKIGGKRVTDIEITKLLTLFELFFFIIVLALLPSLYKAS